jgi:hypothetical protein
MSGKNDFLEQVIKEAARLIPPILLLARETTANIKLGKYTCKFSLFKISAKPVFPQKNLLFKLKR